MSRWHIALLLVIAAALAGVAAFAMPRAVTAVGLVMGTVDPAEAVDRKVAEKLDAATADHEIEAALAANDADLAQSFLDLAGEHGVAIDPALAARVAAASAEANSPTHTAASFAKGLITGEPENGAALAGTAVGDLFVFGDVRDALREGSRLATGEPADRIVLGLACLGLAVTAGTYATLGTAAPVRIGLTVAKAARKSGSLGLRLGQWLARALRGVVDWGRFEKAIAGASIARPAVAVRAARDAVKLDRAGAIVDVVEDIGRVQSKARTRAALDGLKLADNPQDVARLARIAETKGSKTRAILKLLGGGALLAASVTMQTMSWLLWAVLAVFGCISSIKAAVERFTRRRLQRRKERRLLVRRQQELRDHRLMALAWRG